MTTNHTTRSQTPVSFGEIGLGRGTSMKFVYTDLPRDRPALTVLPAARGEFSSFAAALGGAPVNLIDLTTAVEPGHIGEVR